MKNKPTRSLERRALRVTIILIVTQAAALFVSAGTLAYWQAWLYLALFTMSTLASNAYLARHDRALLERRLAVDERGEEQSVHKLFFALLRVVMLAQSVIRSGPYHYVRHPMYTGFLVVGFAAPLCLGSYYAELVMAPTVLLFVVRLLAEERFLAEELPGYTSYLRETPKRLLPGVW